MDIDQLRNDADHKWQYFNRAAASAGIWFLCFIASFSVAWWTDKSSVSLTLMWVSGSICIVLVLLMIVQLAEATAANRKLSTATSLTTKREPG